ncbi:MAG: SH3 domain-containing protein [Anaerolineae bacterium]|nr:SH3 domain-containing protein [Anaerolineae bacterium]
MLKKIVFPTIFCLAVALVLVTSQAGQAQQEPATYYPETGHYLAEPFLSALDTAGSTEMWGPPITEAFEENGRLVQYFERGRWECVEQAQGPCQAELSPLAEMLGQRTPRVASVPDSLISGDLCRYFPETGHNVCFSFLSFYLKNGGQDLLGPPISELTVEGDTIWQYFRQARIEWHTDAPASEAMRFGSLGHEYFVARELEPLLLAAVESPGVVPAEPVMVSVGSFVKVIDTEGIGLRMRAGPSLEHPTVATLHEGDTLQVIAGPESADGFTWWQLRAEEAIGWCASDWLRPVDADGNP